MSRWPRSALAVRRPGRSEVGAAGYRRAAAAGAEAIVGSPPPTSTTSPWRLRPRVVASRCRDRAAAARRPPVSSLAVDAGVRRGRRPAVNSAGAGASRRPRPTLRAERRRRRAAGRAGRGPPGPAAAPPGRPGGRTHGGRAATVGGWRGPAARPGLRSAPARRPCRASAAAAPRATTTAARRPRGRRHDGPAHGGTSSGTEPTVAGTTARCATTPAAVAA